MIAARSSAQSRRRCRPGPGRRLGHAVAAQVEGHQPELVPERAFVLLLPAEVVLRPAVDEQDRRAVRLPPLAHVQLQAAAARHRVDLHPPRYRRRHFPPPRIRRVDSRSSSPIAPGRVGRGALSSAAGLPICCPRDAYERLPRWWLPRDTGRVEPRAKAFVGRAGELGTLERALAAARAGRGAAILVTGDAGIGKTRLAAELARRARDGGFATLLGRSINLVGTELPYQPFAEALRSIGGARPADTPAGSQLRVFEETLALLTDHAAAAPVLLVLEDLHWADTSTLNLVVFLAHNLAERPVVLLATYRRDEPSPKGRMARLADGVRRSGSGLVLDLGPLPPEDLTALLAPAPAARLAPELADAIVARSAGNPFFAEELLAAGPGRTAELPGRVRDLLLQRVERLDAAAQGLLRLAAAAGRDVGYPLLRALAARPRARRARRRCARPSSTRSSSPTRPRAPSGSATRCWPKPSTRRSSPASARSCTPGWPRSCRAPRPPRRPSSRRTGRPRAAPPRR